MHINRPLLTPHGRMQFALKMTEKKNYNIRNLRHVQKGKNILCNLFHVQKGLNVLRNLRYHRLHE